MRLLELRYSKSESAAAHHGWGANCGPHSIAASLGLTLDQVREQLRDFRGWMSPMMVGETLRRLGADYALRKGMKTKSFCNGLNRLQWEGSWLNPGVPVAAAYAHTHWVAHIDGWVLCTLIAPATWVPLDAWAHEVAKLQPPWHITHHYTLAAPARERISVRGRVCNLEPETQPDLCTKKQLELL